MAGLVAEAALPLLFLRAPCVRPARRLPLDPTPCSLARHGAPHKTGARGSIMTLATMTTILHLVRPLEVVTLLVAGSGTHIEVPALVVPLLLNCSPGGGLATVAVDILAGLTSLLASAVSSMLVAILSRSRPRRAGLDLIRPLKEVALLIARLGADMELSALVGALLLDCPLRSLHPAVAAEGLLLL